MEFTAKEKNYILVGLAFVKDLYNGNKMYEAASFADELIDKMLGKKEEECTK